MVGLVEAVGPCTSLPTSYFMPSPPILSCTRQAFSPVSFLTFLVRSFLCLDTPNSLGGIVPLPTTLRSPYPEPPSFDLYRFSAMTLCNLSTHTDCKAALVSLHGLPPLIEMLEGESDLVKRYAAMTLCNLSTLAINQVHQRYRANLADSDMNRHQSLCPYHRVGRKARQPANNVILLSIVGLADPSSAHAA